MSNPKRINAPGGSINNKKLYPSLKIVIFQSIAADPNNRFMFTKILPTLRISLTALQAIRTEEKPIPTIRPSKADLITLFLHANISALFKINPLTTIKGTNIPSNI